uniref:Uncharacterized protein n=1 Tax=Magallana gigas TaxID=29159 RepID=A0A8W8K4L7_MAGGI
MYQKRVASFLSPNGPRNFVRKTGDGRTNGQELGDPNCTWKENSTPETNQGLSHPEVKNVTIRFPNTSVPNFETNYFCMTFDLPTDGDYHVIAMTPVIDNVIVMHHLLLFGCDSDKQGEISGPTACEMGSVQCNTLFGAWTVGSAGQCLYHEAGIRIGQKGIKRVLMQVHWNNPEMRDDYSDSSGMTLHYTPKLRPNSAANSRVTAKES